MKTVVLTKANVVSGSNNSQYTYSFPSGVVEFTNHQVAVSSLSVYYSWPNITSSSSGGEYNNNSFTYTWIDGTTVTVTMPDGYYKIADINAYLQSQMVKNNHYLVDSSQNYVYAIEFLHNTTYYGVQLNCFAVCSATQATTLGYSLPTTATWSLPSTPKTPQVSISASNHFCNTIGFLPGTYPSTVQTTTYSLLSNSGNPPLIVPVSAVLVTCSLVDNPYSTSSDLLYAFCPNSVQYSNAIVLDIPECTWIDVAPGTYSSFTLSFLDQDRNPLPIQDPQVFVVLTFRNTDNNLITVSSNFNYT